MLRSGAQSNVDDNDFRACQGESEGNKGQEVSPHLSMPTAQIFPPHFSAAAIISMLHLGRTESRGLAENAAQRNSASQSVPT